MTSHIVIHSMGTIVTSCPTEYYKFTSRGKFQWLKKKLWAFLNKTGCLTQEIQDTTTHIKHSINPNKLMDLVKAGIIQANRAYRIPSEIFIGPEEFNKILYEQNYDGGSIISTVIDERGKSLMGIKLTVLPYMSGVLVV